MTGSNIVSNAWKLKRSAIHGHRRNGQIVQCKKGEDCRSGSAVYPWPQTCAACNGEHTGMECPNAHGGWE